MAAVKVYVWLTYFQFSSVDTPISVKAKAAVECPVIRLRDARLVCRDFDCVWQYSDRVTSVTQHGYMASAWLRHQAAFPASWAFTAGAW